ncbi:hypothetical protein Hanom_Chr01g00091121 [Helianthus anomalus]
MDGVNKPDKNGKISKVLDSDAENKPFDESRKTGQTSGTNMAFYSNSNKIPKEKDKKRPAKLVESRTSAYIVSCDFM